MGITVDTLVLVVIAIELGLIYVRMRVYSSKKED